MQRTTGFSGRQICLCRASLEPTRTVSEVQKSFVFLNEFETFIVLDGRTQEAAKYALDANLIGGKGKRL